MRHTALALAVGVLVMGCRAPEAPVGARQADGQPAPATPPDSRGRALAAEVLIADAHVYTPYRLLLNDEDVIAGSATGDFDYPRARAGGLDLAFMCVFVPAQHQETGDAREVADAHIDRLGRLAAEHPDKLALARSVAEARANFEAGRVSIALGLINGAAVGDDVSGVRHFFDRGVRYIALAHSRPNQLSDSSYDGERRWQGLSPLGREVVAEMNRLGMMVNVSHLSDEAFYDIVEITKAPIIASSSSARHFTPGWERNIDDDMIRALAKTGGVVGINFSSDFLHERYRNANTPVWRHVEEDGLSINSAEGVRRARAYRQEHGIGYATVDDVADHIDHVVELVGIDHVAIGSDFDGVGDSLAEGLKDVSDYPNLIAKLLERGYSEADVERIVSGNLLRVWSEAEAVARELGGR